MSNETRKFALVTAGDIQLMSAIISGMLSNPDCALPVQARLFSEAAYLIFDQIKAENEKRTAPLTGR